MPPPTTPSPKRRSPVMIDIDVSEDRKREAAAEVCCDVSAVESENQDVNAEDKHEDLNVVRTFETFETGYL